MKGAIVVDTERCKGCQLCIIACPQKVIALANKVNLHGYPYVEAVNEEACVGRKQTNDPQERSILPPVSIHINIPVASTKTYAF